MRSVVHSTFALEREYAAAPSRVFGLWADPEAKAQWLAGPEAQHTLEFREGGREMVSGRDDRGNALRFEALYREIVPDTRIVYTSALYSEETLATASVTTVQFEPTATGGTRMTVTEQGAYLDGHEEPAWREMGTTAQLRALGELLGEPS